MALLFAAEVPFRKHLCHFVLKFLTWPTWKPQKPLWYCLQLHNALLFSYPIPSHFQLSCFWHVLLFPSLPLYTWLPQNQPFLLSMDISFPSVCLHLLLQRLSVDIYASNQKSVGWILSFIFIVLVATHCSLHRSNVLCGQESRLACSGLCLWCPSWVWKKLQLNKSCSLVRQMHKNTCVLTVFCTFM